MNSDQKADFSPNISLNWHLILSISKFGRSCKVLWLCFVKEDFVLFCLLCQELLESYHRSTSIYYSKGNITSSVMAYSHINSRYYQQNGTQNVSQPRLGAVHTKMIGSLWLTVTQTSSGFRHWKKKERKWHKWVIKSCFQSAKNNFHLGKKSFPYNQPQVSRRKIS